MKRRLVALTLAVFTILALGAGPAGATHKAGHGQTDDCGTVGQFDQTTHPGRGSGAERNHPDGPCTNPGGNAPPGQQ